MTSEREILNLLYRYAQLIDAGDYTGLGELLQHAEHTSSAGVTVRGAPAVHDYFVGRTRRFDETGTPRTMHITTNVHLDIDDDRGWAAANSYFVVLQAVPEALPLQPIVAGRYYDEFTRIAGAWRFSVRRKFIELEGDLSEHLL